jgi:hypothetical protein
MPFRITQDGVTIECDSLDELLALRQRLLRPLNQEKTSPPPGKPATKSPHRRTAAPDLDGFSQSLEGNARRVVAALAAHPDGVSTDELAAAVEIPASSLGPIIRRIRVLAQRHNLPKGFLVSSLHTVGGKPKTRYLLDKEIADKVSEKV